MRSYRSWLGLVAALTAGILLAACGSSGGNSAGKPSSAPVLPIGFIASSSGAQASTIGGSPLVFQGWVKSVNAAGGINGHMLKGYVMDDALSPSNGLQEVKELVQQDHVIAIVGEISDVDASWASYIASTGVPVIGGNPTDLPMYTNPDFFPTGTDLPALTYAVLKRASTVGQKFGLLYCAESAQCAQSVPLFKSFGQSVGVSVPVTLSVSASAPNYTAQCQALKSADVSSYEVGQVASVALRIVNACQQQGVSAKPIASAGSVAFGYQSLVPNGFLGIAKESPWFEDSKYPLTKEYPAFLKKWVPNIGSLNGPTVYDTWVATQLFDATAKAAGTHITSASLKRALYSLKGTTLGGITQPLNFVEGQATTNNCWFNITTANGKFALESNKPQCAPSTLIEPIIAKLAS